MMTKVIMKLLLENIFVSFKASGYNISYGGEIVHHNDYDSIVWVQDI